MNKKKPQSPYAKVIPDTQPPDTFLQAPYYNKYKVYIKAKAGSMFLAVAGNQRKWFLTAMMQWFEKYPEAYMFADRIVIAEELTKQQFEKETGHKFKRVENPNDATEL